MTKHSDPNQPQTGSQTAGTVQLSPQEENDLRQCGISDPQQFFGKLDKNTIASLLELFARLLRNS